MTIVRTALLLMLLASTRFLTADECEALRAASFRETVAYLHDSDTKTLSCVNAAFQKIQATPAQNAVPALVSLLGYKQPTAEAGGVFYKPQTASEMYPAIRSLFSFGMDAEPALVQFISTDERGQGLERENASHALLLIRHGHVVKLIQDLHDKSLVLFGTTEGDHLQAAAQQLAKEWCYPEIKSQCDAALNK